LPSDLPSGAPSGSPAFVRPTPRPSPTFLVYEVRAGDTLTSIARQFGTTARSIAYWNRSRYPSLDPDSPAYQPGLIETGWLLQLIPTAVVDEDELPELMPEASPGATPAT
jgi:spore germination protein YaaH